MVTENMNFEDEKITLAILPLSLETRVLGISIKKCQKSY